MRGMFMYNHQLDTFIKTAELGSFGKASEVLYISPPAVIQQINLLEKMCGFKLFIRTNHGVKLTAAGKVLYEDAKTIIRLSEEALSRARQLADSLEYTVRIGTNLLYKCRMLPDIWPKVSENFKNLKIEIVPISDTRERENVFSQLGVKFDMFEGIYATAWDGSCNFFEFSRTPICCAVAKNHKYAGYEKLTLNDLKDETLVMPVSGVSSELDNFRNEVSGIAANIVESAYYGLDTFTMCEMVPYILITQPVYSDIHTNLVTIPLETDRTLPYGLVYANDPSPAVKKFVESAKKIFE